MDWIKQIIECKKGNWESPGSLGQKIKKIRMLRRYTQKELGVMCGFSLSSADVRIAQYEKNKKIPREKILKAMCNALGVGEGALVHADMLSYQEMFYAIFDMEDFHGLHPVKKEDGYYLRFDSDSIINDFLEEWYKMYQKYPRPRGDDEEEKYTLCRYEYPNEIAVVSQYELLKRKALQAEIENLQLKIMTLRMKIKKEIDEMDWKKQIEKLEDELQKLTEKENRIAERKKEVGEKLRKVREQKENEENKQLADIVTEYLGPMDPKKIEDLKVVLDMYMSDQDEERATEKNGQEGEER